MVNHVSEWLGAYHDGELRGADQLRQIEQHLAACAACQAELDEIRSLSALLQEAAPQADFRSTERFVVHLALRLPRRSAQPGAGNAFKIGWWLIPVSLLGLWVFIDITFTLSSLASLAANTPFLGGNLSWLQGNSLQMNWFAATMNLFGNDLGVAGQVALSLLNDAHLLITQIVSNLIPQVLLAVSYLGWLFSWWLRHPNQSSQSTGRFS